MRKNSYENRKNAQESKADAAMMRLQTAGEERISVVSTLTERHVPQNWGG